MLIKAFKFLQHLTLRDQITSYSGNAAHRAFISGSALDWGYLSVAPPQLTKTVASAAIHIASISADISAIASTIPAAATWHPSSTFSAAETQFSPTADCTIGAMKLSHIFFGDAPEASAGNISTANTITVRIYIALFLKFGLDSYLHSSRYVYESLLAYLQVTTIATRKVDLWA